MERSIAGSAAEGCTTDESDIGSQKPRAEGSKAANNAGCENDAIAGSAAFGCELEEG